MNNKLQKKINQIRGMPQFRDKSPAELEIIATDLLAKKSRKKIEKQKVELKDNEEIFVLEEFLDEDEFNLAVKKYKQYEKKATIRNLAEIGKVKSIVILEVQLATLLKEINEIRKDKDRVLPSKLLTEVRDLLTHLDKKKDEIFGVRDGSDFNVLQTLFKKLRYWSSQNQLSREVKCIHCSKPFLLKIRTDKYEAGKHPYLIDQLLGNEAMLDDYLNGIITREQYAKYMYCDKRYVDWFLSHHFSKNNPLYPLYLAKKKQELEEAEKL